MDDNFSSIVKSVLWGRAVYMNIRKVCGCRHAVLRRAMKLHTPNSSLTRIVCVASTP
jgi:hypothetical protein